MAEQETGQASGQAHQNRTQNEGQGSASGSRGGSRGGRRRGRGGRKRPEGSAQGGRNATQADSSDTAVAAPPTTAPTGPAASAAPESSGASRGRRNRRGNRGGSRGQGDQGRGVFSMGPRRQFGGRLTTTEQSADAAAQDASLSANAPEFVPGQPVPQRRWDLYYLTDSNLQLNLRMEPSPAQEETGQETESRIGLAKKSPSPRPLSSGNGFKRISQTGTTNVVFVPKKLLAKPRSGLAPLAGQLSISNVPINGGTLP
ncbi:hypothetical protein ACHAQD_004875 [Fusarium lateritium]